MRLNANFIVSAQNLKQCPEFNLPEFPLIGRSNVGKSSFINTLANNRKLAKTSNTPGKTRLINFFNFSDKFMIADLPGYGYAQISRELQNKWQKEMEEYLLNRESIASLIQFIDARHEPQKNDLVMQEWIQYHDLECIVVATKIDYVSKSKVLSTINNLEKVLKVEVLPFSTKTQYHNEKIIKKLLEY